MKSIYIKQQHCFQEQIPEPRQKDFDNMDDFLSAVNVFTVKVETMRTIPCRPSDIWQEGVLYEQNLDYTVYEYSDENRIHHVEIIPIDTDDEDIYDAVRRKRNQIPEPLAPLQSEGDMWKGAIDGMGHARKMAAERYIDPSKQAIYLQCYNDIRKDPTEFALADYGAYQTEKMEREYAQKQLDALTRKSDVPEAVELLEWIKSLFPVLTVENGNWCLESQITSEKLYEAFKTKKP